MHKKSKVLFWMHLILIFHLYTWQIFQIEFEFKRCLKHQHKNDTLSYPGLHEVRQEEHSDRKRGTGKQNLEDKEGGTSKGYQGDEWQWGRMRPTEGGIPEAWGW